MEIDRKINQIIVDLVSQKNCSSSENSANNLIFNNKILIGKLAEVCEKNSAESKKVDNNALPVNVSKTIKRQKKKQMVKEFVRKAKRNIVPTAIPEAWDLEEKQLEQFSQNAERNNEENSEVIGGYIGSIKINDIFLIVKLIFTIMLFVMNSISLTFKSQDITLVNTILKVLYLAIILGELARFLKKSSRKRNSLAYQIRKNLQKIIMIIFLVISTSIEGEAILDIGICLILLKKIIKLTQDLEQFQNNLTRQSTIQNYWDLIKILLLNFFIAHCLSVLLNSMTLINTQNGINWHSSNNLSGKLWYEKYVWGYYWGTTIMLTVGFGDIAASNWQEAWILVYIETFSCIMLAYNISQVSKLMQKMNELNFERNKKLRIFNKLSEKNNISMNLSKDVKTHIERTLQMEKKFNIQEQECFIKSLPEKLQKEVQRQSNKNIFLKAPLFQQLTNKCQLQLSAKIQNISTHPQEILLHKGDIWKMFILKAGEVGVCIEQAKSTLNGFITNKINVIKGGLPKLISLNFLWEDRIKGNLKSLAFCMISTIANEDIEKVLKNHSDINFEYYCQQKDKFRRNLEENYSEKCPNCQQAYHSHLTCPLSHFQPYKSQVIYKYLKDKAENPSKYLVKKAVQSRKRKPKSGLKDYKMIKEATELQMNYQISVDILKRGRKSVRKNSLEMQTGLQNVFHHITEVEKKVQKCQNLVLQAISSLKEQKNEGQIQVDKLCNYKYYFNLFNPDKLNVKYQRTNFKRSTNANWFQKIPTVD